MGVYKEGEAAVEASLAVAVAMLLSYARPNICSEYNLKSSIDCSAEVLWMPLINDVLHVHSPLQHVHIHRSLKIRAHTMQGQWGMGAMQQTPECNFPCTTSRILMPHTLLHLSCTRLGAGGGGGGGGGLIHQTLRRSQSV